MIRFRINYPMYGQYGHTIISRYLFERRFLKTFFSGLTQDIQNNPSSFRLPKALAKARGKQVKRRNAEEY